MTKHITKKRILKKAVFITILSVVCLLFSQSVLAGEYANMTGSATISTDTTVTGEKWIKGGNLTIETGATLQINADSSLTFEPGYHITIQSGAYIIKSAANATIVKAEVPCVCSAGDPCCTDGCNYDADGTVCGDYHSVSCDTHTTGGCDGSRQKNTCSSGSCTGGPITYDYDSACTGVDCGTCCLCNGATATYDDSQDADCGTKDCDYLNGYVEVGSDSPSDTNYCKYRDYYDKAKSCTGLDSCSDPACDSYSDTTEVSCGICQYVDQCNVSFQTCGNYSASYTCPGITDCDPNDYYYESGSDDSDGTNYCKYRDYDDVSNVCDGGGNCVNGPCSSYSDSTVLSCGLCNYVDQCSDSAQTCGNYDNNYCCPSAGGHARCNDGVCYSELWSRSATLTEYPDTCSSYCAGWAYFCCNCGEWSNYEIYYCFDDALCSAFLDTYNDYTNWSCGNTVQGEDYCKMNPPYFCPEGSDSYYWYIHCNCCEWGNNLEG